MPGVLRAEAPIFQPSLPGLDTVAGTSKLQDAEAKLPWTTSPATTAFSFSSEMSDSNSPWISPFQEPNSTQRPASGSGDFSMLPELALGEDSLFEGERFRLDGLDELQDKVASLLKIHGGEEETIEVKDSRTRSPSPGCSGGDASGSSTDCDSHSDSAQLATASEVSKQDESGVNGANQGDAIELVPEQATDSAAASAKLAVPTKQLGGPPGNVAAEEKEVATRRPQRGWATAASKDRAAESESHCSANTTVLLRNLPKRCSCSKFVDRLEEMGFRGALDFLYVPVNLKSKCHTGEAFLNFHSEEAAGRFTEIFHKANTKTAFPGITSSKPTEVTLAPVQGLEANVRKLQRSGLLLSMLASQPEWLPRIFDKDGRPVPFPGKETEDGAMPFPSNDTKEQ